MKSQYILDFDVNSIYGNYISEITKILQVNYTTSFDNIFNRHKFQNKNRFSDFVTHIVNDLSEVLNKDNIHNIRCMLIHNSLNQIPCVYINIKYLNSGELSVNDIKTKIHDEFPYLKITQSNISQIVDNLYSDLFFECSIEVIELPENFKIIYLEALFLDNVIGNIYDEYKNSDNTYIHNVMITSKNKKIEDICIRYLSSNIWQRKAFIKNIKIEINNERIKENVIKLNNIKSFRKFKNKTYLR